MLSDKELKSLIKITGESEQTEVAEEVLDISHQQFRRMKQELDLNRINVTRVDASYNFFKSFDALNLCRLPLTKQSIQPNQQQEQKTDLDELQWMDISFNFLKTIENLGEVQQYFLHLKYLNVSANRLESINLTDQEYPNLESLHLKSNKIKYFTHCPIKLKVLTLDHNELSVLAFSGGDDLQILSAGHNMISSLAFGSSLMFLDLQNNRIEDLSQVKNVISTSLDILSINLLDNPISKTKQFKIALLEICNRIVQINDVMISPHIREGFQVKMFFSLFVQILKAEDQLTDILEKTNQKYLARLEQKYQIKEELLRKMENQEQQVEDKFLINLEQERQQLELLEMHAKNMLGKSNLKIAVQKDDFQKIANQYMQRNSSKRPESKNNEKVQEKHKQEYEDYIQKVKKMKEKKQRERLSLLNDKPIHIQKDEQIGNKKSRVRHSRNSFDRLDEKQLKKIQQRSKFKKEEEEEDQMNSDYENIDDHIALFDKKCIKPLMHNYLMIDDQDQEELN